MTGYEIVVYPPRAVHTGTREADMLSHLNAVEGTLQATRATRAGGERMKVQIRVEYWGRNRFVVRVLKDGVTLEQLQPATRATVEARRHRACERWSELGYEVEAEVIPDAWDLRG